MRSERIEFPGSQGTLLAGRLEWESSTPNGWALLAHCFTCSKDIKAAVTIAHRLVAAGFGVLRFDFTGLGGSEGDFSNTNFSSNIDDLVLAADWLRAERGTPALLIGHSLGGAAVIAAAHRIADSKAVATVGAPFDPGHIKRHFGPHLEQIEKAGSAVVQLAGRPFTVRRQMLEDLKEHHQQQRLRTLNKPILVLHAPRDEVVSIEHAGRIFQAAMHPKSFVSLHDACHLLREPRDARYAADVIASWVSRYLDSSRS